ncbi:hypothetical protein HYT53_00410 [Candidatus Woesearchaeota archaeon]|nr:hypothetical protein [Candidatus Woesearchaeota archaeon]
MMIKTSTKNAIIAFFIIVFIVLGCTLRRTPEDMQLPELPGQEQPPEPEQPTPIGFVDVNINAGRHIGELPATFKAGMWVVDSEEGTRYIFDKFASENAMGVMQFQFNVETNPLLYSESLKDYKLRLMELTKPGTELRHQLDKAREGKAHVSMGLGGGTWFMPRWLSAYNYRPIDDPVCNGQASIMQDGKTVCDAYSVIFTELYGYNIGGNTYPNDWNAWKEVVQFTAKYYYEDEFNDKDLGNVKGLGIRDLSFWFGHEPDWGFFGSENDFFLMYGNTAKSVKNLYPGIKVGGIGTVGISTPKTCPYPENLRRFCTEHDTKDNEPMMKNFIEYAGAKKVQIDFLNYHQFGEPPIAGHFEKTKKDVSKWLKDNGFDADNVILYPADWSLEGVSCDPNAYPQLDSLDTEYRSAYVISALYAMEKAGIQWHSHDFDVYDAAGASKVSKERKGSIFDGCWPIFTRIDNTQIIKPVYNAFRALSMLAGKKEQETPYRLEAELDENSFVAAIASQTKDKKTTRVLLSNFVPSGEIAGEYRSKAIKSCLSSKGYSDNELKSLLDAVKNRQTIPQKAKEDASQCQKEAEAGISSHAESPVTVKLAVSGLSTGSYIIKRYTIDKDNANSCRLNKKTEASPSSTQCGINGIVEQKVKLAKDAARAKGKEAAKQAFYYDSDNSIDKINSMEGVSLESSLKAKQIIIDGDYIEEITMQPYAVILVEIIKG